MAVHAVAIWNLQDCLCITYWSGLNSNDLDACMTEKGLRLSNYITECNNERYLSHFPFNACTTRLLRTMSKIVNMVYPRTWFPHTPRFPERDVCGGNRETIYGVVEIGRQNMVCIRNGRISWCTTILNTWYLHARCANRSNTYSLNKANYVQQTLF